MMMVSKNKRTITLAKDFKISYIDSAHATPQNTRWKAHLPVAAASLDAASFAAFNIACTDFH